MRNSSAPIKNNNPKINKYGDRLHISNSTIKIDTNINLIDSNEKYTDIQNTNLPHKDRNIRYSSSDKQLRSKIQLYENNNIPAYKNFNKGSSYIKPASKSFESYYEKN